MWLVLDLSVGNHKEIPCFDAVPLNGTDKDFSTQASPP